MNNLMNLTEVVSDASKSFTDIRAKWKARAALKNIIKEDVSVLCIYRAVIAAEGKEGAIERLNKSFTPITNQNKLNNGAYPYFGVYSSLYGVRGCPVYNWLDETEKKAVLEIAKSIKATGKVLA
jgi:hypothetical protein